MSDANDHPYKHQPAKAFWRRMVQGKQPTEIGQWYEQKWPIGEATVATAGSCFAQHIGHRLRKSGFNYLDVEPAPRYLDAERHLEFGYGMYSGRYGNVYTTRQLLQLIQRATGEFRPSEPAWALDKGFVDPFRPTIEALPLESPEEVIALRDSHLRAVAGMFEKTDVFVFTLGLTEAWLSKKDGAVFPICPGTQGGRFDASQYAYVNFNHEEVRADLEAFIARARTIKPSMRFLLTVSPVPLMATASPHQVVVASSYSKSVLRSVAGMLADKHDYIDYFPSYEIISSHVMRGNFYGSDMRSVEEEGVEHVMAQFFAEHQPPGGLKPALKAKRNDAIATPDKQAIVSNEKTAAKKLGREERKEARRQERKELRRANRKLAGKEEKQAKKEARRKAKGNQQGNKDKAKTADDIACDEELLAAFGEKK